MTNPLLTPFELPPFSKILPEHVVPAVTKALNDCRENVERVVAQGAPYTWENLCQPFHGNFLAVAFVGQRMVLAIAAAQGAAGKEEGAAALCAGNAGLLPEMQGSPSQLQCIAHAAETGCFGAVYPTFAGT